MSFAARLIGRLPLWLAAVWAISLGVLGLLVVPMLFLHLPEKALAGAMAGKLFGAQAGLSTACCLGLLLLFRSERAALPESLAQACTVWVLGGVLLALLVEFAVAPHIVARDNLALWHRVGSAMFLLQWVCALVVFWKLSGAPGEGSGDL